MRKLPDDFRTTWKDENGRVNYDEYLQSPEWREKRLQVLERDGHTCQVCCISGRDVEVHHLTYRSLGDEPLEDLITVCKACHHVISSIEYKMVQGGPIARCNVSMHEIDMLKRQYMVARNFYITQIILESLLEHRKEIPQIESASIPETAGYIANVIEAVRENRHISDMLIRSPESIAHQLKDGTFRKGVTMEENVAKHLWWCKRFDNLPEIPKCTGAIFDPFEPQDKQVNPNDDYS